MTDINQKTHYDDMDEMGEHAVDRYSDYAKVFWRWYFVLLAISIVIGYELGSP